MSGYGPDGSMTYAEWLRWKSVAPMQRTHATQDQVLIDTPTQRTVRDQLGHDVTERTDERGRQHRDVTINLRP
ncbi:hypothetical protein GCM10017673_56370 [Streptosporangium violaceochromogenes]|nr:hypothetical protein GCM10017673_56370 [Streptosporangium violaceochromogenes]